MFGPQFSLRGDNLLLHGDTEGDYIRWGLSLGLSYINEAYLPKLVFMGEERKGSFISWKCRNNFQLYRCVTIRKKEFLPQTIAYGQQVAPLIHRIKLSGFNNRALYSR